ncbi:carbohydrate ABC transporter permease [Allokutzneria sp. NRRL B-24872]|uniref:carbohydrate ABC transporter permease n=1 Tax=Allokutzneria sp. NRRL B-24872 TaxID=1137961 RepID=UPI000A366EED|nr:sugar ABC transporter permease [Allokutzneria sp. NRRL B-24872]
MSSAAAHTSSPQATRKRKPGNAKAFWLFVGPFAAGLVIFAYLPIGWSLLLSFFNAHNTVTPTEFVGVDNYVDMLTDGAFLQSMGTFTLFALFIVPLTFVLSLALALLVNQISFMRTFFRSVFFLPTACSYVVASLIWKLSIFNGLRYGLANAFLSMFGIEPIAWTVSTDPPWYWLVLVSLRLWLQLGFYMILFIAGLQRIPQHLYEAAWIDGAKPGWQTLRHITLPQLRATSVSVVLLTLIAAYQAFDEFYNVLGSADGYPPFARPPLVYLYYTALGSGGQDFGHGSAGAVILALLIALVTLLQGRLFGFRRGE